MSDTHPGPRTPPERLAELADLLDDDVTRATFLRGLAIGALVGAAIAGTLIGGRRRRRRAVTLAAGTDQIGVLAQSADGSEAPGI